MTKILVTGANGFVGSALCDTLHARGINFLPAVRQARQDRQFAVGDLSGSTKWADALAGCDVVIHLAARVHVMNDKSNNPLAAFRAVNVDATMNLARQAVQSGVKRFIFISSVKVNGEETSGKPFTAFDKPMPIDPYGQSKLEAEIALRELSHFTGLEVVIVRPPLVYGPGVRANFRRLMQLVRLSVPLPLGAIHNYRSMVSLDNLVDLLVVCSQHPDAANQTFMVSDDCDVSTTVLLRMLSDAMGRRSLLLPVPSKLIYGAAALIGKSAVADRLLGSLQVDITHTKTALQWRPATTMQESLIKTVAHFLNQH
ncbi:SDR family oxidoreductase [Collimonas sp.]|jgi:nucleoside-diphosphate-sugar epimerase|uniref:UDP-glucose 4-epimerase family protein n=1 Tax=Collimonas sp. TaxID=1963772 RepID=UPI002C6C80EE|nr:SDR family oxidoreductase [Collimonas sp.]HWW04954.1 SDR family oxidoreductase [Collimonas sp.]